MHTELETTLEQTQKKWHLNGRNVNNAQTYTHTYDIKIDEFHQPTRNVIQLTYMEWMGDRSKRSIAMNVIC